MLRDPSDGPQVISGTTVDEEAKQIETNNEIEFIKVHWTQSIRRSLSLLIIVFLFRTMSFSWGDEEWS